MWTNWDYPVNRVSYTICTFFRFRTVHNTIAFKSKRLICVRVYSTQFDITSYHTWCWDSSATLYAPSCTSGIRNLILMTGVPSGRYAHNYTCIYPIYVLYVRYIVKDTKIAPPPPLPNIQILHTYRTYWQQNLHTATSTYWRMV